MPALQQSPLHLETAHILFLDVVGYSKLLVNVVAAYTYYF
jgi:hypothetical protein